MGLAAIGGIDQIEAADAAVVHRAPGDLIGGIPVRAIGHAGQIEPAAGIAFAVAKQAVELAVLVGLIEGTVVVQTFDGVQQMAVAEGGRIGQQDAPIAVFTEADRRDPFVQRVGVSDADRAR